MLKRSYDWIVSYSNHPHAIWVLAAVSFAESSISPIPPLPLLIPMCLANPAKAWFYSSICALASVLGGVIGYLIGAVLYDTMGIWIITLYGLADKAEALISTSKDFWFYVLVTKGLTPIPFKIVTIMSGFLHYNILLFIIGSLIARFTFYLLFAVALRAYGEQIKDFIEKQLKLAAFILVFFLVGGFFVLPAIL